MGQFMKQKEPIRSPKISKEPSVNSCLAEPINYQYNTSTLFTTPPPPNLGISELKAWSKVGRNEEARQDAKGKVGPKRIQGCLGVRGSIIGKLMKQKSPKSTLLGDNTQGLKATKQTQPRPVTSAKRGGGSKTKEILMKKPQTNKQKKNKQ